MFDECDGFGGVMMLDSFGVGQGFVEELLALVERDRMRVDAFDAREIGAG